jgi:hypothetical protein
MFIEMLTKEGRPEADANGKGKLPNGSPWHAWHQWLIPLGNFIVIPESVVRPNSSTFQVSIRISLTILQTGVQFSRLIGPC